MEDRIDSEMQEAAVPSEASSVRQPILEERYERTKHIFSTRTAECFEAVEKTSKEKIYLWLLRFPLRVPSEEAQRFVRRLEKMEQLGLVTPQFRAYGVVTALPLSLMMALLLPTRVTLNTEFSALYESYAPCPSPAHAKSAVFPTSAPPIGLNAV